MEPPLVVEPGKQSKEFLIMQNTLEISVTLLYDLACMGM